MAGFVTLGAYEAAVLAAGGAATLYASWYLSTPQGQQAVYDVVDGTSAVVGGMVETSREVMRRTADNLDRLRERVREMTLPRPTSVPAPRPQPRPQAGPKSKPKSKPKSEPKSDSQSGSQPASKTDVTVAPNTVEKCEDEKKGPEKCPVCGLGLNPTPGKKPDYVTSVPPRVPLDRETIPPLNMFARTPYVVLGARVWQLPDGTYRHRDTLHTGRAAEVETYNSRRQHTGAICPHCGTPKPGSTVGGRRF